MSGFGYGGTLASAAFVAGAFNSLLGKAREQSDLSKSEFEQGGSYIDSLPHVPDSDTAQIGDYTRLATRLDAAQDAVNRAIDEFATQRVERDRPGEQGLLPLALQDRLADDIAAFFETYFPNVAPAHLRAMQEMRDAITQGSITVRPSVEDAAWQAVRDEILRTAAAAERDLRVQYAGHKRVPGALVGRVADLWGDAQRKVAEASNKLALAQFDREAAAVKRYVELAAGTRVQAMNRFGEYMTRMVELRYQQATERAGERDDFRRALKDNWMANQAAQSEAELWTRKLRTMLYETERGRLDELNKLHMAYVGRDVEGAIAQALRLATIAATAFNGMQGNASVSGYESEDVSI